MRCDNAVPDFLAAQVFPVLAQQERVLVLKLFLAASPGVHSEHEVCETAEGFSAEAKKPAAERSICRSKMCMMCWQKDFSF